MRNLDNYESILDNEKNFLHGKLVFCQKGTTTQEPVFAWDSEHDAYVSITPIVYTDVNGRPNVQIYLADKDYTIYVYKYIGNGDMSLDSDDDNWSFQYSFNNLYNVFGLDIKSNAVSLIDSMASLKATDPINIPSVGGEKLVALGGYNAMGDCPVVYYKWDSASSALANDVDIVQVTGISTGRWILVNTFEETGIFDVRHAGCFPKDAESDVEVTQSYALKKADTYASKFGLTLFVPSIYENDFSFYIGTNVSIYSKIWFADGAKIVTATSLTLNDLSERNEGRNYPFMLHSDTNNGSIDVAGDLIHTSWFENTETANPSVNYPPSINCRKKFVYDGTLGVQGSVPTFTLANMDVEILSLLENESINLTNCNIVSDEKIKHSSSFTNCEIKGTFFDSSANLLNMNFSGCVSDIDTWSSTDKYVYYAERNGNKMIDLKGRECTIDYDARHIPFPFNVVNMAVFSGKITIPSGSFLTIIDSEISDIVIDANNSVITNINVRYSGVCFDNLSSYSLSQCKLDAEGSWIESNSGLEPTFKSARLVGCTIDGGINVSDTTTELDVIGCEVKAPITATCTSSFSITFDQNVIKNNARLVLESGNSLTKFVTSSFCNNVVEHPVGYDFIIFTNVAGFDVNNIGQYVYKNNSGVAKFEDSASVHCRVKYRKYGNTDTGNYVSQTAASSNDCILVGDSFKLSNFFFSFGEKTKSEICVKVECGYLDDALFFKNDKSLAVGKGEATTNTIIYENGIDADTQILHGEFGSTKKDYIFVSDSYADGVTLDFVLNIKKIERVN